MENNGQNDLIRKMNTMLGGSNKKYLYCYFFLADSQGDPIRKTLARRKKKDTFGHPLIFYKNPAHLKFLVKNGILVDEPDPHNSIIYNILRVILLIYWFPIEFIHNLITNKDFHFKDEFPKGTYKNRIPKYLSGMVDIKKLKKASKKIKPEKSKPFKIIHWYDTFDFPLEARPWKIEEDLILQEYSNKKYDLNHGGRKNYLPIILYLLDNLEKNNQHLVKQKELQIFLKRILKEEFDEERLNNTIKRLNNRLKEANFEFYISYHGGRYGILRRQ